MADGSKTGPIPLASSWRQLIQGTVPVLWSGLVDGALWVEAQLDAESGGNPDAVSSCGALGLLQLMPSTAAEVGVSNPLDPAQNIRGGITYLRRQYEALEARVPEHLDRLAWALASYNAGRGYILRALGIAEMDAKGFHLPGPWYAWEPSWRYLAHRESEVNGRWSDYRQTVRYVERIKAKALALGAQIR